MVLVHERSCACKGQDAGRHHAEAELPATATSSRREVLASQADSDTPNPESKLMVAASPMRTATPDSRYPTTRNGVTVLAARACFAEPALDVVFCMGPAVPTSAVPGAMLPDASP